MVIEILSAAAAVVAAALSYVCFRAVSRSLPVQIIRDQSETRAQVQAVHDTQESHLAKLVTWREDMEGIFEAVESTLDRVETKRRSAAASASRIARANGEGAQPEFDPSNRQHLIARARAMGITDAV